MNNEPKGNWFVRRIKKYQVITFTFGFLFFSQIPSLLIHYYADKDLFLEKYHLSIWVLLAGIALIYFIQWLIVTWAALRFPKETLKQKFLRHPIATIILFIIGLTDLPYRLSSTSGAIVSIFETIVYHAFLYFLWWLLVCWISSKIFKKERFQWVWYRKIIEKVFVIMPIAYKLVLCLIVALILFITVFILFTVVFKYSGQDLKFLFS